jgi:hypothetical protein
MRRTAGNAHSRRDLVERHAAEKMQLDDLRCLAVDFGQFSERFVNRQYVIRRDLFG